MKQTIFCVAGMHRTGSSLFANWLYNSNIFIGYNLYGKASSNQKGHFEDFDFLNLHRKDLQEKNLDISGLFVRKHSLFLEKHNIATARKIIKDRGNLPIWGWKEPRTTLYLQSWKKLIPQLKVIILVRDKEKVVSSLYKRLKKTKWYYTRNPLKRISWWIDIDLRPNKWCRIFEQTYDLYYVSCQEFKELFPNDIIYITLEDVLYNTKNTEMKINNFLHTKISFVDIKSIYDPKLMTT